METATDIHEEEYYIEPLPAVGRCRALFDFEGIVSRNDSTRLGIDRVKPWTSVQ